MERGISGMSLLGRDDVLLENLVSVAVHKLRNPLSTALLNLQCLHMSLEDEKHLERLNIVFEELEHIKILLDMINRSVDTSSQKNESINLILWLKKFLKAKEPLKCCLKQSFAVDEVAVRIGEKELKTVMDFLMDYLLSLEDEEGFLYLSVDEQDTAWVSVCFAATSMNSVTTYNDKEGSFFDEMHMPFIVSVFKAMLAGYEIEFVIQKDERGKFIFRLNFPAMRLRKAV